MINDSKNLSSLPGAMPEELSDRENDAEAMDRFLIRQRLYPGLLQHAAWLLCKGREEEANAVADRLGISPVPSIAKTFISRIATLPPENLDRVGADLGTQLALIAFQGELSRDVWLDKPLTEEEEDALRKAAQEEGEPW